ncbi:unnamed protein product, partial [Iphiclides podalirius]
MDDVYENLENYEDLKQIDELKFENKELKSKIEKYNTAIDTLQKDYDKLAAEHKKLEHNYSSLLKTARAEIERKTLMIKELNIEKDKLVISARQSRMVYNPNKYKKVETVKSKYEKKSDSITSSTQEVKQLEENSHVPNSKSYCKNDNQLSLDNKLTNGKTNANACNDAGEYNQDKNYIQEAKSGTYKDNNMEASIRPHYRDNKIRLKKISERRKSMPLISDNEVKFSSDEDCEQSVESKLNKNYPRKDEIVKRHTQDYNRVQREMDFSKRRICSPLELKEQLSCQSPDHVYSENFISTAPIKEIMNTAVMHLEDPRLTSKKYKVISNNDKEFLTTVVGRNVVIEPVNKTLWGFNPIPMPKALLEPPVSYAEELDKNIYLGFHMDQAVKDDVCNNSTTEVVKDIVDSSHDISKHCSENNMPPEVKSMPQLVFNPKSLKEENNFDDNIIQDIDDDMDNDKGNKAENKHYGFDVSTKIVEDDLILSDETNDVIDTRPELPKKENKAKPKKQKELKNFDKIQNSNTLTKVQDCLSKKEEQVLDDKEISTDHAKRHKGKKKLLKTSPSTDQSKGSKSKKNKKEKDTKTHEIKTKFNDLFGDSSSLITPDDLGIVIHEKEVRDKYATIYEDTQAAVDLNLEEIEETQTSKISGQDNQNDSVNEQVCLTPLIKAISHYDGVKENKYEIDENLKFNDKFNNDRKMKSDITPSVVKENIDGNINVESHDIVKTVIISTGSQPQHPHDNVVTSTEKPIKTLGLHALATSTPAKMTQETPTKCVGVESVVSKPQDCSSSTNSTTSKSLLVPMNQLSGENIDSHKDEDVPDVRIFVKRRRKVKRVMS